jgi:nucleoside-diphosphate-sugar epimerase
VKDKQQVMIIGCGYVGRRLAAAIDRECPDCVNKFGLVRDVAHLKTLRAAHVEPIVLDLDRMTRKDLSPTWFRNSVVFYLVPPPNKGESDTRMYRLLNMLETAPSAFIYISTTGVYGNTNGEWVNEATPVNPQTTRAERRISAEQMLRIWCTEHHVRRVVLRCPAIYGPGRLPLDRLKSQPNIDIDDAPLVNRIHVDDLVQVCIAAAKNPEAKGVYNVSDGNSINLTEYLNLVARVAGLPEPDQIPLDEAQLNFSDRYLSYLDESRRIDNSRVLRELGVKLKYADVEAGLRASLDEERLQAVRRTASNSKQ